MIFVGKDVVSPETELPRRPLRKVFLSNKETEDIMQRKKCVRSFISFRRGENWTELPESVQIRQVNWSRFLTPAENLF